MKRVLVNWPAAMEEQLDALAYTLEEEFDLHDLTLEKDAKDKDFICIEWERSDRGAGELTVSTYVRGFRNGAFPPPYPPPRKRRTRPLMVVTRHGRVLISENLVKSLDGNVIFGCLSKRLRGWAFVPAVAGRKTSRKRWETKQQAIPDWVYRIGKNFEANKTETVNG